MSEADPHSALILTKRNPVNWPERMLALEFEVATMKESWRETQKESQYAMSSLAASNEKLANHFEDSKRIHARIDGQAEDINELKKALNDQEKLLVAIIEQNKQIVDFNQGLKRAGWAVLTGSTIFVFWLFQKWFEKHGGL